MHQGYIFRLNSNVLKKNCIKSDDAVVNLYGIAKAQATISVIRQKKIITVLYSSDFYFQL